MIWQQSWKMPVPRPLRPVILDERFREGRRGGDVAKYIGKPQKRNRLISHPYWQSAKSHASSIALLDEPPRNKRRRRDHDLAQYTGKPDVLSTSVVDLFDFFKCFPGLKWTIGSRLLRYYNPATAHPLEGVGNELRTRNTGMMTFLSPCAAATTLQQLRRDIESMKLSFDENRVRMDVW